MAVTTQENEDLISQYFEAWISHDTDAIRRIFSCDARYIILNKDRCYSGIEEIASYWNRNKRRQRDVRVQWKTISTEATRFSVEFVATFQDVEERQNNTVTGIIFFLMSNGSITELRESYTKFVNMDL